MFLQIDVDIGSSTVANGVLRLVIGAITTLVVDMAFLVQVLAKFGLVVLFNIIIETCMVLPSSFSSFPSSKNDDNTGKYTG